MNCLEIITVRVAEDDNFEKALKFCSHLSDTVETGEMINLNIYQSANYSSDISVHIKWAFQLHNLKKSLLGLQFARGLGNFGRITHTLWLDKTDINLDEKVKSQ
jgi:hypothetical protein